MESKSLRTYFVGYSNTSRAYYFWNLTIDKIIESFDYKIDEGSDKYTTEFLQDAERENYVTLRLENSDTTTYVPHLTCLLTITPTNSNHLTHNSLPTLVSPHADTQNQSVGVNNRTAGDHNQSMGDNNLSVTDNNQTVGDHNQRANDIATSMGDETPPLSNQLHPGDNNHTSPTASSLSESD